MPEVQVLTPIRQIIKRDIGQKVEGVVKVFDRAALAMEFREYVLTDKIEAELKTIVDTFAQISDTLRRGGQVRDVMGIWLSGFFGSGKSHFAKILGFTLANVELDADAHECAIDALSKHLSDTQRGRNVGLRLGEIKLRTAIKTIPFEIKSRESLTNPGSVGEILIGEFYRSLGYSENFVLARLEIGLERRGLLAKLEDEYEKAYDAPWRSQDGRDDLLTVKGRLRKILPKVDPEEYPTAQEAREALDTLWRHEKLTAEGIADELVRWVDEHPGPDGRSRHLVFVIDEVGTFIGDSNDKIGELNSLAEMIGNKGKGKVWLIVTSQQDLEKVVDRTNFQPALVGRLNARFELKPHLVSDEINKVVSERILKKRVSEEAVLRDLYKRNTGHLAQLADLKATRSLGDLEEDTFVDAYPFMPHLVKLSQDVFEALSGFRLSGGVRSMISVVMGTLQEVGDEPVGTIVSFDQVFDAVENDLLSQEYLGAAGVGAIRESDERVLGTPIDPARVLKVLWLLKHAPWVPRVPETLAKLLARSIPADIAALRQEVELTLAALQMAGYVGKDEATGEWKYLSERERTIEQAIQDLVRPGGAITMSALRKTSQQLCKDELLTRKRLGNFTVSHGKTKVPFPYGVVLDGETIEGGPELEVEFLSPLAAGRKDSLDEIRRQNVAGGTKGRKLWWTAHVPDTIEARFRRYEALVKITGDKRFVDDPAREMQDALAEKRKERDDLKDALVKELEKAFLAGTVYAAGQELDPTGSGDLKEPIDKALAQVIPNVFPRFADADRSFDFAKDLKAVLNPATTALHQAAAALDLFDTQGSLQAESTLVSRVLEVIHDLEDEGVEPTGAILLDAKDRKDFRGFGRAPFAWPEELVRLVLAACLRAGAIYIEQPTSEGLTPVYDYRDKGDLFSKVTIFKKLHFKTSEATLSVDQIKEASKALIAMGVTGVAESGNALAAAVRKLGAELKTGVADAKVRAEQGLPLPDSLLKGEGHLTEPTTQRDPTKAVTAFLAKSAEWKALHADLKALRSFLDAKRHVEYDLSREVAALARNHPVPTGTESADKLAKALADMDAIVGQKAVVNRWAEYREASESATGAYREAYRAAHAQVRTGVKEVVEEIRSGRAYKAAPADARDSVVDKVFGKGGPCHYPEPDLGTARDLLGAAALHSLSALSQALVALPGYRAHVEAELRDLAAPPPSAGPSEPERPTVDIRRASDLVGRRFTKEPEVDSAFDDLKSEIKAKIRDGYVVVLK